ncbi:MAG: right-handed parallel beta-helix repeat-containing protein [Candidatus Bipolaricaulia bacterium]
MKTLLLVLIAGLLLSVAVFASETEENYYYDESCEICPALAEAHKSFALHRNRQPFSFDLSMVLALMEEKLNLAVHLASVAAHPLWPHEEELALYVDQLLDLVIYREDAVSPRKVDTVSFLHQSANAMNPYVEYAVPLEGSADYVDAYRNVETYLLQAYGSLDACREALALGDLDMAVESMQRAYAALLAMQGHADRGLASGLRTMIAVVETRRVTVRVGESIQEAIDRLEPGGTILLEPGIYHESLVINKSLALVGASIGIGGAGAGPITVIDGSPTRVLIQVGGAAVPDAPAEHLDVTIEGVELRGGLRAVDVGADVSATLADVEIDGAVEGLVALSDCNVEAKAVRIHRTGTAVLLGDDVICDLTGCRIEDNLGMNTFSAAVFAPGRAHLVIDDCDISWNDGNALFLMGRVTAEISDSRLEGNVGGLVVMHMGWGDLVEADRDVFPVNVTGCGNVIPGPEAPNGNLEAAIYPKYYDYLLNPCSPSSGDD